MPLAKNWGDERSNFLLYIVIAFAISLKNQNDLTRTKWFLIDKKESKNPKMSLVTNHSDSAKSKKSIFIQVSSINR